MAEISERGAKREQLDAKTLRQRILALQDIDYEEIYIPEWGVTLRVKALTGKERARLMALSVSRSGQINMENLYHYAVAFSVVDEQGARVFEDGDVEELSAKNGAAIERIAQAALRLSGLSEESLREAEKN